MSSIYLGQTEPTELKARLYIATGIALSVFLLLTIRLWYLQIFSRNEFRELSENNRIRLVRTIAPRGLLIDRAGKIIVENRPAFNLVIIPEDVQDWEKVKSIIQGIVDITGDDIEAKGQTVKGTSPISIHKTERRSDMGGDSQD